MGSDRGDRGKGLDEARRIVLSRRAKFVAAAVAGVGILGCDREGARPPEVPVELDAGAEPVPPPQPCLSPVPPPVPPTPPLDAGAAAVDGPPPTVCLSVAMEYDAGADAGGPRKPSRPDAGAVQPPPPPPNVKPGKPPKHPPARICLSMPWYDDKKE